MARTCTSAKVKALVYRLMATVAEVLGIKVLDE
jgi:hypothetical protein